MDPLQAPSGDLVAGADGRIHCRWFADQNLDLLTKRLNLWLQELGKAVEICSMSHSVEIFDRKSGDGLCTALVMWRLRKRKLKQKKTKQEAPRN